VFPNFVCSSSYFGVQWFDLVSSQEYPVEQQKDALRTKQFEKRVENWIFLKVVEDSDLV